MANTTREIRIAFSSLWSLRGIRFLKTFSTKVVVGASIVAEAVDITADKTAPKNIILSHRGMYSLMNVGRISCGASAISLEASSGAPTVAAMTINIGTKANSR